MRAIALQQNKNMWKSG